MGDYYKKNSIVKGLFYVRAKGGKLSKGASRGGHGEQVVDKGGAMVDKGGGVRAVKGGKG